MSSPSASLPPGVIQFFDAFEPGLKEAEYRIDVTQDVSAPGAEVAPVSQTVAIRGPRFTIDPSDVHSVFPPNGATSTFASVLPHVVLGKRLLPWERDIPGLGAAVPWLAVLVFQDGELAGPLGGGTYAQSLTVDQLLAADPNVRKPVLQTVLDDERVMQCQAVTFSSTLFAQIAPTARELPFLAHARQVNTGSMADFDLKDDGWFSVIVGNRFPQPGAAVPATCIVHLVSLEGFGDLLAGNTPVAPSQPQVQMVSLASWTFSCVADPSQTFAGLAQNLAYDGATCRPAASLLLRLPFTPSPTPDQWTAMAEERVAGGYVALGWRAPSGEDGFAWYRGPFTAVVPNAVPGAAAFETSDAATIYDASTGVFDHSLAVAWQAGRSLAIANQPFATALMRVRRRASAVLEARSAPTRAQVHSRLAAAFSGGAIQTVARASTRGGITPAPARARRRAAPAAPAALRTALAQPGVQTEVTGALEDDDDMRAVTGWLGELLLLRMVPFVHLVPDARMLPPESIRFFYVDPNWLTALADGALAVGLGSSRESAIQVALRGQLQQLAETASRAWRAAALGQPAPAPPAGPIAGFLLRSALVAGWPAIGVTGASNGTSVPLLRLEQLGPGVLIALFNGVPDTVTFAEPPHGLAFGVDDAGDISTRTLTPPQVAVGSHVKVYDPDDPASASPAIRAGGQRVLNVSSDPSPPSGAPGTPVDLIELIAQALKVAPAAIGPALFAVQMVNGPSELQFSLTPPPRPS